MRSMVEGYARVIEDYWKLVDPALSIFDFISVEDYLVRFERAEERGALLLAAHYCEAEVCNGGFDQLFRNTTGILAPEAVLGFNAIGQPEIAGLVSAAMAILCDPFKRERAARVSLLDLLPRDHFYPLEERFFAQISSENGGFLAAANRYALDGRMP